MTNHSLKHLTRLLKSTLAVMLLLMAFSCSKSGSELVGVWDNVNAPESVEFKPDNSGMFTYQNSNNPPLAFSWKETSKNIYILDVDFMGNRKILTTTVSDKGLSIESAMGKELYKKHVSH